MPTFDRSHAEMGKKILEQEMLLNVARLVIAYMLIYGIDEKELRSLREKLGPVSDILEEEL